MDFFRTVDFNTLNVVFMSMCFFFLYTADTTIVNVEKTIISSIQDENKRFEVEGYDLLALVYLAFGTSLWLGPSAVSFIGLRTSMVVASALYTIYVASFAMEKAWLLYLTSTLGGIAAGLIWTAEGKYLVLNSPTELVSRNIGIFWTLSISSGFWGNLYTYYQLRDKTYIDRESRLWIIYGLALVAAIATVLFAFLRSPKRNSNSEVEKSNPTSEMIKTWKVFISKEMLILYLTFAFTGLQHAFAAGAYSASIGFTLQFGDIAKQLVPLSGIFLGLGEVLGGCWQLLQEQCLPNFKWNRRIIIIGGIIVELLTFSLVFINIPAMAVFADTTDKAIINSNVYIALLCSMLLGISDGCLNTQNLTIISLLFPSASAQACALYKFMKAFFIALGYALSSHLNLHYQLALLTVTGLIGLLSFVYVDILFVKSQRKIMQHE